MIEKIKYKVEDFGHKLYLRCITRCKYTGHAVGSMICDKCPAHVSNDNVGRIVTCDPSIITDTSINKENEE
jgi:hypothetical protein